jgi:hypothetical protein
MALTDLKSRYSTFEELGEALIASRPDLEGRDPREIGKLGEEQLNDVTVSPESFGDIDIRTTASNLLGDVVTTGAETVKGLANVALSPIETAGSLATIGLTGAEIAGEKAQEIGPPAPGERRFGGQVGESVRSVLSTLGGSKLVPSEKREAVEGIAEEFKHSVSPAGIQERPALAASNILSLFPGKAVTTGAAKAGLMSSKTAAKVARTLDFADPGNLPFKVAGAGVRGVKRLGKGAVNKGTKIQDAIFGPRFLGRLTTEQGAISSEILNGLIGFTTGSGSLWVKSMAERAGTSFERIGLDGVKVTEKVEDAVRFFRNRDPATGNEDLLRRSLRAVDRFKKKTSDAFDQAMKELPMNAPLDIQQLQQAARGPLANFKVKVKGGFTNEPRALGISEIEELDRLDQGLSTVGTRRVPTGEAKLVFPEFGEGQGITTTISSFGSGQAKVEKAFLALINGPPAVLAEDLYNFRRAIDDAISVASGETSAEARAALVQLRKLVADELSQVPEFAETMKMFEEASLKMDRWHDTLGIDPGKLTKGGAFKDINVEEAVGSLLQTMDDSGKNASRLPVLDELAQLGGDGSLVPAVMGITGRPIFGNGLVVKSELSNIGRGVGRMALAIGLEGTLSPSLLGTIPAAAMFSPRAMSEVMLQLGVRKKGGPLLAKQRQSLAEMQKRAQEIATSAQKIDRLTGGKFREIATREGISLGTLLQRLESQSGEEVGGLDFPEKERQESLLGTLGRGRLSSPGNRLER